MKKHLFILFVTLAMNSVQAFAHEGHVHVPSVEAPPHGGLLRDAPPFKSEIVLSGDVAKVYIYDKNLKPVKLDQETLKGDLQFPREKKAKSITFTKNGDFYETKLPGISKVHRFDMHVYLEAGGQKAKADFGIDNIQ